MATSLTRSLRAMPALGPKGFERRRACRFHTVMRVARVNREGDCGLWRVRNISDEGMMLVTAVPVARGEPLELELSPSVSIRARAAWWDGERCGVRFEAPIDCAATLKALCAEQRAEGYRPPRLRVDLPATAYCERGLHGVRLTDLSQHGAAFAHDGCFAEGMQAKLVLRDGDEHRGVVRWSEGGRAGLLLTEPFPCARLESAARL